MLILNSFVLKAFIIHCLTCQTFIPLKLVLPEKNAISHSYSEAQILLKMPFSTTFPVPAHSYEILLYSGLGSISNKPLRVFWTDTISLSWELPQHVVQVCIRHINMPAFAISSFCLCHHPLFQIISSLMIGTVSYSFLSLSQNLPHSR